MDVKNKVFITGGSGFIGTNLIELLEENGEDFFNFDKKQPLNQKQSQYWIEGNLLNRTSLYNAIKKVEPAIIIHLAAKADCESDNLDDYKDNTEGTQNLIDVIKQFNCVKHVIIASTQYVYKSRQIPFPIKDDHYIPHTTYGESKVITEEITRKANLACCWTIIRPANIWGPWHMRYPNELWNVLRKGVYVHPSKKPVIRTYGYVKNIVFQIFQIINAPKDIVNKKTFYLGDLPIDSYIWLNTISNAVRKKNIKRIFPFALVLPSLFGEILKKMNLSFPLHMTRFRNMVEDFYSPTNLTINQFGLLNSDLKENVDETVDWIKCHSKEHFPNWQN